VAVALTPTVVRPAVEGRHAEIPEGLTAVTDQLHLDPTRTALLVMDYQVGLLDRLPAAEALLERVGTAVADVRARGGHVGWVQVAFYDADLDAIPPASVMAHLVTPDRRAALHPDAPTSQIHHSLSLRPRDITVRKTRVGAFTTTDLDQRLRDRAVTTLVLAGISTSGVVLSTVREAMDRDYRIVVLNDACADPDPDSHTFLTGRIFPRHTTVIDVTELPGLWK
jgi:nicotinamidase-related amidase